MDAKDEVKARLNIEDVISEYVQLKRSGGNFKGLSPFGAEKSPSFMVSPEKQIWHDFSSGRGGDMFSFVMEIEGLDFKAALELLARKAGVDLEEYRGTRSGENSKLKERLYQASELACKFYQVQFSKYPKALEYVLGKRKFSKETALQWRLGYSPTNGSELYKFLKSKDFNDEEIQKAGLSSPRYKGSDMFRGRIMVPLADAQGRIIGFTARLLENNDNAPKYINTPQTPLYDKSRHVFGLHLAKEAIRQTKVAVLVEGNLDVISSHQVGIKNVVATAGTALTEPHLKVLSRFTGDIRLSFDADKAGINATERAIPIASKVGVSLSIITIPSGKDPDELIQQDPKIWERVIEERKYALDWLMDRYKTVLDTTSAQGKREFSDVLLPIVRQLTDSVEQDHYVRALAETLGVSAEALRRKMTGTEVKVTNMTTTKERPQASVAQIDRAKADYLKTQDHLLLILLHIPELRKQVPFLTEDMFVTDEAKQLFMFLKAHPDFKGEFEAASELKPIADYGKILGLQYEELYRGVETLELDYEVTRLQAKLIQKYAARHNIYLRKKLEQTKGVAEREALLTQVNKLNVLLKQAEGRA